MRVVTLTVTCRPVVRDHVFRVYPTQRNGDNFQGTPQDPLFVYNPFQRRIIQRPNRIGDLEFNLDRPTSPVIDDAQLQAVQLDGRGCVSEVAVVVLIYAPLQPPELVDEERGRSLVARACIMHILAFGNNTASIPHRAWNADGSGTSDECGWVFESWKPVW